MGTSSEFSISIFEHAFGVRRIKDADRNIKQNHLICDLTLGISLFLSLALRPISYPTKRVLNYEMIMGNVCACITFFSFMEKKLRWGGGKIKRECVIRSKSYAEKETITNVFLFVLMRMIFSFGPSVRWVIFFLM